MIEKWEAQLGLSKKNHWSESYFISLHFCRNFSVVLFEIIWININWYVKLWFSLSVKLSFLRMEQSSGDISDIPLISVIWNRMIFNEIVKNTWTLILEIVISTSQCTSIAIFAIQNILCKMQREQDMNKTEFQVLLHS